MSTYNSSMDETPVSKGDERFQLGDDFFLWHDEEHWFLAQESDNELCYQLNSMRANEEIHSEALGVALELLEEKIKKMATKSNEPTFTAEQIMRMFMTARFAKWYECELNDFIEATEDALDMDAIKADIKEMIS